MFRTQHVCIIGYWSQEYLIANKAALQTWYLRSNCDKKNHFYNVYLNISVFNFYLYKLDHVQYNTGIVLEIWMMRYYLILENTKHFCILRIFFRVPKYLHIIVVTMELSESFRETIELKNWVHCFVFLSFPEHLQNCSEAENA